MREKKLYIVRGNHDGNLGVYSSLKRAFEVAKNYAEDSEPCLISYLVENKEKHNNLEVIYEEATYERAMKILKSGYHSVSLYRDREEETYADIEKHYMDY